MILAFELLERSKGRKGVSADEETVMLDLGVHCLLPWEIESFFFVLHLIFFFSLPNTQASYELEVITVLLWM